MEHRSAFVYYCVLWMVLVVESTRCFPFVMPISMTMRSVRIVWISGISNSKMKLRN